MKITDFLTVSRVIPELSATDKNGALKEMAERMASEDPALDAQRLLEVLLAREKISSTGIGEGVAIPHGKVPGVRQIRGLMARSRQGVPFDALDGGLTHLFFLLVAPEDSAADHLKALARISRLLKDDDFRHRLMKEKNSAEIFNAIKEEDGKF